MTCKCFHFNSFHYGAGVVPKLLVFWPIERKTPQMHSVGIYNLISFSFFPFFNLYLFFYILEFRSSASTPSEADDLIEITEEADLIQEERMIDDEPDHDDRGRANAARKLIQMEEMMLALDLDEVEVNEGANEEEWKVNMD